MALSLGIETAPISSSNSPSSQQNELAQLVSLHESGLPLVATLLTLTLTVSSADEFNVVAVETEATAVAAFLPGPAVSVGQGILSRGPGGPTVGPDDPESEEPGSGVSRAVPAAIAPWERFVLGLDEAIQKFQRDNPGGVMGAPARDASSDRADSPPAAAPPAQSGPTSLKSNPAPVPSGGGAVQTEEAVDAIIESGWGENGERDSRGRLSYMGQLSGRLDGKLPVVRVVDSPPPRSDLPFASTGRITGDVLPPVSGTGKDEPNLAFASLVVAGVAAEWGYRRRLNAIAGPVAELGSQGNKKKTKAAEQLRTPKTGLAR